MAAISQVQPFDSARLKRTVLAARARVCARLFLIAVGSLAAGAVGDVALELAIGLRAFGTGYLDRSHLTIVPVCVFAVALLLLGIAWRRMDARYDDRWLVTVARDTAASQLNSNVAATAVLGLFASLAMERAEQALGGGLPFGGLPLLSPAALGVALVFSAAALLVVTLLGAGMHAIVAAFDLVARAVQAVLVWIVDAPGGAPKAALRPDAYLDCGAGSPRSSRRHGERAPPRLSLAAF